jgi:uncharacterized protein YabN with tetrapyrrole methylase and pyrophosphatase domain
VLGSLTCVGIGIQFGVHAPDGARRAIAGADAVFHLAGDHATAAWLKTLNPSAESLHDHYQLGKPRMAAYEGIVERVLAEVRAGKTVCFVTYGHPGVFAYPTHEALRRARDEGYHASMLPAVSAIDCLFADLGVDPGRHGFQCYEATDFLARQRIFDPASTLVLLQVGLVGDPTHQDVYGRAGLPLLAEVLERSYGRDHEVVIYEAARFPVCEPTIQRMPLAKMIDARISAASTLYVPPKGSAPLDADMLARLRRIKAEPQAQQ